MLSMLLINQNEEDQDFSSVPTMPSACPAHPHDGNREATQGLPAEAEFGISLECIEALHLICMSRASV